ncbi:MAG: prepilin peptidase, partial [Rickettsiales bacterium]|nr:prepilin peptidase [Rickettsiales bacterium]
MSDITDPLILGIVALFGLAFGSFATLASYRIPRGTGIVSGRSECPSCHTKLAATDLVPVFSWLFRRGRCGHCGAKVSVRYPLIELTTSVAFVLVFMQTGFSWILPVLLGIALCLILITVIDLEHMIIPDVLNLVLLVLGGIYQWMQGASWQQMVLGPLLGLALGFGLRWLMFAWKKQEGLGLGDVKFLTAAGMLLPIQMLSVFLFLSGVIGMV